MGSEMCIRDRVMTVSASQQPEARRRKVALVADGALPLRTDGATVPSLLFPRSASIPIHSRTRQVLNLDKGKKVSPFSVPALLPNTGSGIMAIELGCTGPNYGVVSACAAGSHAIGTALRQVH